MAMAPWHLQPPGEGAKLVLIYPDNTTTTIVPWLSSNMEQLQLLFFHADLINLAVDFATVLDAA